MEGMESILNLVRNGPMKLYQIAKALNVTYGTAQYYVTRLEQRGLIKRRKIACYVVVYVDGQNPLDAVTEEDLMRCLARSDEKTFRRLLRCLADDEL